MIESSYILKPSMIDEQSWRQMLSRVYAVNFKPNPNFVVPEEHYDVGISIRRGEFLHYFQEANQSREDLTKWITESFNGLKVVIFSDDHEFRNKMRIDTNYLNNPIEANESWIKGFLEFLMLAKCDRIYGTPSSSFAEEAALFGNKPYNKTLTPKSPTLIR